jgi:transcription antitermination factor NusG
MAPLPIDPQIVAEIRSRAEVRLEVGWQPNFYNGDAVVVEQGPFRGLQGVFDGTLSSKGRVRVLLDLVSRQTPVELDGNTIRLTSSRRSPAVAMRRSA